MQLYAYTNTIWINLEIQKFKNLVACIMMLKNQKTLRDSVQQFIY